MHPLLQDLLSDGPVVTDGAWGTQMQELGLGAGDCPDAWNLARPEAVESVARRYVDAGSQIILTNTFRANRIALAAHGLAGEAAAVNRAGAEISRRAAAGRARVFASMGPTGVLLATGEIDPGEVRAAFDEQAAALAEGGAEGIVVETQTDPVEASLAVAAAKSTGLPVVACMVFDSGRNRDRTLTGTTPEQASEQLTEAGADVVGANCGQGIEGFVSICRRLREMTDRPLWIKANAGLPVLVDGRVEYPTTASEFARHVSDLLEAGASFVGGCCGTSPEYVRAMRQAVKSCA